MQGLKQRNAPSNNLKRMPHKSIRIQRVRTRRSSPADRAQTNSRSNSLSPYRRRNAPKRSGSSGPPVPALFTDLRYNLGLAGH